MVLPNPPVHYVTGSRRHNIQHTRLRLGSSTLNSHLHRIGLHPTNSCDCGSPVESTQHYLLHCPLFTDYRNSMFIGVRDVVAPRTNPNLLPYIDETKYTDILLHGSPDMTVQDNIQIFKNVQVFIEATSRFNA